MSTYQISVPDSKIAELEAKLAGASFPDEIDESAWDYGAPLADVKRLTKYWKEQFDWRAVEAKLNELPNFHKTIKVDGFDELDIHYLYQPSESADAIPLLFSHGWPGSYLEVTKMLAALRESSSGVAFHVVAPSLPNFAWSEGPKKKGFAIAQYAECCHRLMLSLGYNKYVTQGGDWGFYVTRLERLADTTCDALATKSRSDRQEHSLQSYSDRDRAGFARTKWFLEQGSGYRLEQSTKPQTLGYALHDSPVALLAWIYEKLHDWTDDYPWTEEEVLTWVSIYYFSRAGPAASIRIYYEATHAKSQLTRDRVSHWIPKVKLGLCYTPRELEVRPLTWGRTLGPVAFESQKERGGHFAAWEIPGEIVSDLRAMFGKDGKCYRITGGKPKL